MSYILEALKKSDAERKRGEVPTLNSQTAQHAPGAQPRKSTLPWIVAGVLGVAVVGLGLMVAFPPTLEYASSRQGAPKPQAAAQPPKAAAAPVQTPAVEPAPDATPAPAPALESEPMPEPVSPPVSVAPAAQTPESPAIAQTATSEPSAPASEPVPSTPTAPATPPTKVTVYTPAPRTEPENPKPAPAQKSEALKAADGTPKIKVETRKEPFNLREEEPKAVETETAQNTEPTPAPPTTAPPAKPVAKIAAKPQPKSTKPSLIAANRSIADAAKKHVDQAWAAIDKGFYNQAMRDLARATEIEPNYAEAWFARGWANEKSGNELSAMGDYARAISSKPDHAFALFSRAYLNLYVGSAQSAVTDFVRAQGVARDPALRLYTHLWLFLSRDRAGQDALARLAEDTADENLTAWPAPLVRHFLGEIEEGRVLAAIDAAPKSRKQEMECTGYFFLGISALNQNDRRRARQYFEKALATGALQFRQYDAAKRELDRLNR